MSHKISSFLYRRSATVDVLLFCFHSLAYLLPSVLQQSAKTEQIIETVTQDKLRSSTTDAPASVPQPVAAAANNEEEVDIDLGDPEVQKAAVFIQSGFKGFKQRKISQGLPKVHCLHLQK